ncbi:MurR/RpiR family transcriptional regulator [Salipaludibacillus agaradhaerens]|uniref:MurR/RpiR family transcriptional regulator n=1 Tax=Salipaludibacillus agaradhaerens TaxID=76935 RepID=A0A9Q4FYY6_SALAG|nr:MurR/RpiR family transcriptional regulator [Salipaludibacillus agaradhaerens]MCR6096229.1 MurR/RpiR family transcriptional regulator [Salipaludibacillus agaradhaerens]MCR6114212.1 MurR/RpiR family transcriptional regulator [Salipaludibacillus agaradhaerens]
MQLFNVKTANLSPNQIKIADYINRHLQDVLLSTEKEIAEALNVSTASVSRFWKSVGYHNLKDFKRRMREIDVTPVGNFEKAMERLTAHQWQHDQLEQGMANLKETMRHLSASQFDLAVEALVKAETVYIYSPGPSKGLGVLMHHRLKRFGLNIVHMTSSGSDILEDMVHFKQGDLVVLFGFVRMLSEAKVILGDAKKRGYQTLLITDQLISEFTGKVDIQLFSSRGERTDFHSMIGPTFLIENVILAIGMKKETEALTHLKSLTQLRSMYADELPR